MYMLGNRQNGRHLEINSYPFSFFQLERGRFEIHRCGRFFLFTGDVDATLQSSMVQRSDPDDLALSLQVFIHVA